MKNQRKHLSQKRPQIPARKAGSETKNSLQVVIFDLLKFQQNSVKFSSKNNRFESIEADFKMAGQKITKWHEQAKTENKQDWKKMIDNLDEPRKKLRGRPKKMIFLS